MHDYELGKQEIDVSLFDDETRNIWCFKVTHKRTTKVVQTKSDSKTIAEHQTFNGKVNKSIMTVIELISGVGPSVCRGTLPLALLAAASSVLWW